MLNAFPNVVLIFSGIPETSSSVAASKVISLETSGLYNLVKEQNFSTFSLDYYTGEDKTYMIRNFTILRAFCEKFVPGQSDSFLFIGATGLGKTHLSSSVACSLIEKGAYVVYETSL